MDFLCSHPVLTCAEAKVWEGALLRDEASEWSAMQRAGSALAAAITEDYREIGGLPESARLLVLAGKGHNGGDALLAAQALLANRPLARVDVILAYGEAALRPLARRALLGLCHEAGTQLRETTLAELKRELPGYDLCLDGVFGFQFHPPMDEATGELLAWVNTHPRIKLRAAVDLPSGVGEKNGGTDFRADFTYATGIVKSPLVEEANAALVGRLRYLDLGFFALGGPSGAHAEVLRAEVLAPLARLRPAQTDKRTYGHLLVVGGSRSYPGAVLMTVQAALRSGVGLLTAYVPASLVPEYAARLPEAMWVGVPETKDGGMSGALLTLVAQKLSRASALAIGPGLGTDPVTLGAVQDLVQQAALPMLLDADALRPEILAAAAGRRVIATPHVGEAVRIASATGWLKDGVLVRKGSPTRVQASERTCYSFFGGPVLARGGSGDLLSGIIGGLLAQGPDDLLLAACRGVVWHGFAADLLARDKGQVAVQTTQLLDYLQSALKCV